MKNNLFFTLLLLLGLNIFFSCSEDNFTESIFIDGKEELDPKSYSYKFDKWLQDEYLKPYNLRFRYKMEDVGADMDYNLVPTGYDNAQDIAILSKYLWFDVYGTVIDDDFLKKYGPRIIHLIGSPAFNPASGTMILGLAEGGLKVSLYRCNSVDYTDVDMMNEFYFKTMHHEFAHILHQKKSYPNEFRLISTTNYSPFGWQDRHDNVAASMGFVSAYAGSEDREDFVEVIANYIVKTDEQWATILDNASKGWEYDPTEKVLTQLSTDPDGVDGRKIILDKLTICRKWLKEEWNVSIDELREEVQKRQAAITPVLMDSLRNQITNIPVPVVTDAK